MKTSTHLLIALTLFITSFTACKKESSSQPEPPQPVTPLATPAGISSGTLATRQIGPAGGEIKSADQKITVNIPAGALETSILIGIEPISNTNVAGMGKAYRLTPHGQTFSKPVEITLSWADHADSIGMLETMGLAYQMENGVWKFVGASNIDRGAKTISYQTKHFSDWSLMNQVSLSPYHAELEPGQSVTISALLFTQTPDDDLLVPLVPNGGPGLYDEPGYPVGRPEPLPVKYIKQWKVSGPGKITNLAPSVVKYDAPASANGATAAVSLELKAPPSKPGQYLLVCNIKIGAESYAELSIGGGGAVRFPVTISKSGNRYMVANPEDEGGGYFLLTWVGGEGDHGWDLENQGTYVHFVTPSVTYMSRYINETSGMFEPSTGSVSVTRLSGGWAEGTFVASKAGMSDTFIPTTSLSGKFKVKMMF